MLPSTLKFMARIFLEGPSSARGRQNVVVPALA